MIKDLEELEKLDMMMQKKLQVDLILQSLTSLYDQFIVNYHMNKLNYTLSELVNMSTLKDEKSTPGTVEKLAEVCIHFIDSWQCALY